MVAYCPTALAGGTCTDGPCTNRHDISRCEPCGCSFPASLLGQHRSGKKHLRNVAANGTTSPVMAHQPPPPTNLPHPQPMSLPSASSPAIGIQNPISPDPLARVTVSHESGLDFIVKGTERAGQSSFSPVEQTITIKKTEVLSSLSFPVVRLVRPVDTPASCFTVSVPGETSVVQKGKPRKINVSFQAPHAGTFRASLEIMFNDKTRQSDREFVVSRELHGKATLPSSPASVGREGTGITVSHESGLEFSLERAGSDVLFVAQTLEVVVNKSSTNPLVSLEGVKVRLPDGSVAR
ncbi:hypothetical protein EDB87DRAFT_763700 [Lactarius vividus]|nr:hypothetical protein EDB87DRAFT_763700 [Lactarius vividus]